MVSIGAENRSYEHLAAKSTRHHLSLEFFPCFSEVKSGRLATHVVSMDSNWNRDFYFGGSAMKIEIRRFVSLSWLALLCSFSRPIHAQFTSGIDGTAEDTSGASVPGALVTITDVKIGVSRTTRSNESGYFRIDGIAASTYNVGITKSSFEAWSEPGLVLKVGEIRTIAPVLQVGQTSTTINVSATTEAVDLTSATTGAVVAQTTVSQAPLVGQNVYGLAALAPGVMGNAISSGDNYSNQYDVNINAAGQRQEYNSFRVDGAYVMTAGRGGAPVVSPNPEIVDSLKINTNEFDADKGIYGGASVQMYTVAGTNALHGTGDFFYSNNSLTARTEFQSSVPAFTLNEGGITLGGPILKNHLFGFGAIDVLRSSQATTSHVTAETQQFSNYVQSNFPGSVAAQTLTLAPPQVYPASGFLTVAQVEAANPGYYPPPNIPSSLQAVGVANINYATPRDGSQWSFRFDQYVGQSDRIFGMALRTALVSFGGNIRPALTPRSQNNTTLINMGWTHIFSSRLANEAGVDYMRPYGDVEALPAMAIPLVTIVGTSGFSDAGPYNYGQNVYQFSDALTWTVRSHEFRFGVETLDTRENDQQSGQADRPSYSFNNLLDFVEDKAVTEGATPINVTTLAAAGADRRYLNLYSGVFAQDDWKVRPNLTLNFGLRYDDYGHLMKILSPPLSFFTLGSGTTRNEQIGNGIIGPLANGSQDLLDHSLRGLNPRGGFSWDAFGNGRTAIRGGFGLFSSKINYTILTNNLIANLPFNYKPSISVYQGQGTPVFELCGPPKNFGNMDCPLVIPTNIVFDQHGGIVGQRANIGGLDARVNLPQVENWTVSIEQQLQSDIVFELNYSGSHGSKLPVSTDINRFGGDLIVNRGVLKRLNPSFGATNYETTNGTAIGNYGSAMLTKRGSHGLTLRGIYTWGKTLDIYSTDGTLFSRPNLTTTSVIQADNFAAQRGRADYDIRQQVSVDGVWTLPNPWAAGWQRDVMGGWRLGGVAVFETGLPFTVYTSAPYPKGDYNADGYNYDVPNVPVFGSHLSRQPKSAFLKGLFSASSFPTPAPGQEGNLSRNTYDAPGYQNVDCNVDKLLYAPWFHGEKLNLEVRAEVFNLFNRVNLSTMDGNLSDPLFGRASGQLPARSLKLHLRAQF